MMADVGGSVLRFLMKVRYEINDGCRDLEPWAIILASALFAYFVFVLIDVLCQDEPLLERCKKYVFGLVKSLPVIKGLINTKMEKTRIEIQTEVHHICKDIPFVQKLPQEGWSKENIIKETDKYSGLGSNNWRRGRVSGTVYNYDEDLVELATEIYGRCAWSNPLHHDVFPGVSKMEAEVVRMVCNLFNGGPETCGVMTYGGTESILLACKAYRDRALSMGIRKPQIVASGTAHAAFDKAAALMHCKIVHIPFDSKSMMVNLRAMRRAITKDTCMLVASAPHFPHGIIDPIEEIAKLGVRYGIPVHVDACLGGFLLPFLAKAGFPVPKFDFRLNGVTSISCDTHKYGAAPKGTSVLMYKNEELRHFQFFVTPDWPGGIYASPSIPGSRSGGIIATCWATMLRIGENGYVDMARKIMTSARQIKAGLLKIDHVEILGDPLMSVIAFGSNDFNIYRLSDDMTKLGWNLNALQFPSSIHICVTMMHTKEGVVDQFLTDVKNCVTEIMKDPKADKGGKAAIYGMAQSIPDRSMVSQLACYFLDACYSTAPPKAADCNGHKKRE